MADQAEVMWRIGTSTGYAIVDADRLNDLINGGEPTEPTEQTSATPVDPNIRTEADVAADPRRLGWTFDQSGSRWSRG